MISRSAGLARKPYIAGLTSPAAPTFTAVSPVTAAKSAGTQALVLTGTFVTGLQYALVCDSVMEQYCTYVNATTLNVTIRMDNKATGAHLLRVYDPTGQSGSTPAAGVTFTIT